MSSRIDFTSGSVPRALIHFALPVMFALFLQAMLRHRRSSYRRSVRFQHGVSAVATGSQIMQTVTNLISSLPRERQSFWDRRSVKKSLQKAAKLQEPP